MMQAFATLGNSGALIVLIVTYIVFSVAAPSFFGLQNLARSRRPRRSKA